MCTPTNSTKLTALQAVQIHGWLLPIRRLTWDQVCKDEQLTFASLYQILSDGSGSRNSSSSTGRSTAGRSSGPSSGPSSGLSSGLSLEEEESLNQLYRLQPSMQQWISAKKIRLQDYEVASHRWKGLDPLVDFEPDHLGLCDLINTKFSAQALLRCGLTVDKLITRASMNWDFMVLFGYTLAQWQDLGFSHEHLNSMRDADVARVFGATRGTVSAYLNNHHADGGNFNMTT